MENNKRLYLFNTRSHRNIYFISKHQILNQKPLLYRPICIWSTRWIFCARCTSGSSALDHQLNYHQWIICAWQCRVYHNINMIMENNKRLDLFNTRPHRNIYFISKHQILNQRPLLHRPISIWFIRWIFCARSTSGLSAPAPPGGLSAPAPPVDSGSSAPAPLVDLPRPLH